MEGEIERNYGLFDYIYNIIPYMTLRDSRRVRLLNRQSQKAFGRTKSIVIRCNRENCTQGPPKSLWKSIIGCRMIIADNWNKDYLNLNDCDWQRKIRDLKILRIQYLDVLDLGRMESLLYCHVNYSGFHDIKLPVNLKSLTVKESTTSSRSASTFYWETRHLPRSLKSIEFTSVSAKALDLTQHIELQEFIIDGGNYDSIKFPTTVEEVVVLTLPVIDTSVGRTLWDCLLEIDNLQRLCLSCCAEARLQMTEHAIKDKKGLVIYTL